MDHLIIKSRRDIPAVEIIASEKAVMTATSGLARPLAIEIIRSCVERLKSTLETSGEIPYRTLLDDIIREIHRATRKKISRVINGTGILVHTNLGRAPLSDNLFDHIRQNVTGYGNLEFDIVAGRRGRRGELTEIYLALLSGAESGTVVNNNAAALFLILNSLANRRPVVISRSELVQIGGGFRIPDIIKKAGARLLEIGTTNITTLDDYREALKSEPALILKVHRSNFALAGFTEEVSLKNLTDLARRADIPIVNDLGSGVFIDTSELTGVREPTVQSSVADGSALTCFSGDKLLGGVQSGLIVGSKDLIERIKKNPVYRVVRPDKIVFSALEKLLGYYLDGTWKENIKLWRLAAVPEAQLYEKGQKILREIGAGNNLILEGSQGEMGGGALPEKPIPSVALVFQMDLSPETLARRFREAEPPVIGRISEDRFLIDLRAVDDDDVPDLIRIIKSLLK